METIKEDIARTYFEQAYISLRGKEGRIYSDEQVSELPQVTDDHLYKKEWDVRKASCKRLIEYLQKKEGPLKILEIGCGNGWLANQLATLEGASVKGVDINWIELDQAARVFADVKTL